MSKIIGSVKDYILNNPNSSDLEVCEAMDCSKRTVFRAKAKLKEEGKEVNKGISHQVNKKGETSFKQDKDGAEYTFNTTKRIISKEDLVEVCDIDLTQWQIERWVCNKWEVGAKDANKQIQVTPLFQIKLWLKPLHTEKQSGILEVIEEIVDRYSSGKIRTIKQTPLGRDIKAIKATLADMHVGLDPNPNKRALYSYKYGEKEFNQNLDRVFKELVYHKQIHGKFDVLIIDDLGDGMDGWNGFTTRGGHKLQQNLDNTEQFRVFVEGKLRLVENVIEADIANKVIVRNVTDDNHSGDFAYTANWAIQKILSRSYSSKQVEFYILKKFMEHFTYGDHTFILTHGKDKENMFKGLPLSLNEKAIKIIDDYIRRYKINTKHIHLEKGDLHQVGFEKQNGFDYRNFMSFAPPSAYVQNNFGDGYSGFSIQVVRKFGEISHTDYYFDVELSEE